MMDMDDHEDDGGEDTNTAVTSLTGFLFGNIDEKGELEEDFLDEVAFSLRNKYIFMVNFVYNYLIYSRVLAEKQGLKLS